MKCRKSGESRYLGFMQASDQPRVSNSSGIDNTNASMTDNKKFVTSLIPLERNVKMPALIFMEMTKLNPKKKHYFAKPH